MLKGLKLNVADATFDNGDKTALFEFSHPATEQTPALTDYRYIGHMPNNYVKFNCDNDGTNCEIWRIIGVFSVDDGTGNYEQRIKLVRGSAFAETMQYDNTETEDGSVGNTWGKNAWNLAKLNIFLNGDYLTSQGDASAYGLKGLAQSQIANAKYYLGGKGPNYLIAPNFGSTVDMYSWERGTEVYNQNDVQRSISWIGKVALMYPSDYAYVYSKGVENECFNDPHMCFYQEEIVGSNAKPGNYNHPETGWIYNSNVLDEVSSANWFWTLSPYANDSRSVFNISSTGEIYQASRSHYASDYGGIRPVVYLKSSIQITRGEGTEQNPYTLSY